MSRIGRMPIAIPPEVTVKVDGNLVSVKGPKGELSRTIPKEMILDVAAGSIEVNRPPGARRSRTRRLPRPIVPPRNGNDRARAAVSKAVGRDCASRKPRVKIHARGGLSRRGRRPARRPQGVTTMANEMMMAQIAVKDGFVAALDL